MSDRIKFRFTSADVFPSDLPRPRGCIICHGSLQHPAVAVEIVMPANEADVPEYGMGLICHDCRGTPEEMADRILGETEEEGLE